MSLVPYLYAAFARYQADGTPPFRALVMDHPDDVASRAVDDQWLIGDDLLFAPLFAGQSQREVYLPPGVWFEVASGARHEGGQRIVEPAALERILLYVRGGTILPLAAPIAAIARTTVFQLNVRVYGDAPRPFELFEDDGETEAWRDGARNRVTLSWRDDGGQVTRDGDWPSRRYAIVGWQRIGG